MLTKDTEVFTLKEVEAMLQVTRRTLYNWIKDKNLNAFKVGKEWRVTRDALEDFTRTGSEA